MTKYKVFTPNANKKVEFTKEELEKLLNEVYNEGYTDGKASDWTVSYGSVTTWPYASVTSNGEAIKPLSSSIMLNTTEILDTTSKIAHSSSNGITSNKNNT